MNVLIHSYLHCCLPLFYIIVISFWGHVPKNPIISETASHLFIICGTLSHILQFEDKDELHTQDDCYPFIFTNIKGPILVKEEDMDTYIRSHEDDFIGQAEEPLPRKSCQRLFELFDIDTDWLEL